MSTRPHFDLDSMITDARAVHAQAARDAHLPAFRTRLGAHELAHLGASIEELAASLGTRSTTRLAQVAAGTDVTRARAAAVHFLGLVRTDAKLAFPTNRDAQHAFGVGADPAPDSSGELEAALRSVHAAAVAAPAKARAVHLDGHALHALEDLIHALVGSHAAHTEARHARHDDTLTRDSLAHAVSAEVAHLRLIAHRVFVDDAAHLARYTRTLPRHEVHHREPKRSPPSPAKPG